MKQWTQAKILRYYLSWLFTITDDGSYVEAEVQREKAQNK